MAQESDRNPNPLTAGDLHVKVLLAMRERQGIWKSSGPFNNQSERQMYRPPNSWNFVNPTDNRWQLKTENYDMRMLMQWRRRDLLLTAEIYNRSVGYLKRVTGDPEEAAKIRRGSIA